MLAFKETLTIIKMDFDRKLILLDCERNFFGYASIFFSRGSMSVLIYRLKRYFYFKEAFIFKLLVRILKYPEFHFCHNEIDPRADIGPGLVISNFGGLSLGYSVIIGKNCTFMGRGTPTLGAMEGISIENDRIRIGDYCVFGHNAKVINPVTIADGVQIKANAVLMNSVTADGAIVGGYPARKLDEVPLSKMVLWNPILSTMMTTQSIEGV